MGENREVGMTYEEFVLEYTNHDMDYHRRYGTTGIEFGRECWEKATNQSRADLDRLHRERDAFHDQCRVMAEEIERLLRKSHKAELDRINAEQRNCYFHALNPYDLENMLNCLADDEISVKKAIEHIQSWVARNYSDDMLPPVGQRSGEERKTYKELTEENARVKAVLDDAYALSVGWAGHYQFAHKLTKVHPEHQRILDACQRELGL